METDHAIVDEFIVEAREHLDTAEKCLLELEQQSDNKEVIDQLFRCIHSIKGAAGFLNFQTVNDLSHLMESLLALFRAGTRRITAADTEQLLEGVDSLNNMVENIAVHGADTGIDIQHLRQILQGNISGDTKPAAVPSLLPVFKLTEAHKAKVESSLSCFYEIRLHGEKDAREDAESELTPYGEVLERKEKDQITFILFATMLENDLIGDAIKIPEHTIIELKIDSTSPDPVPISPPVPPPAAPANTTPAAVAPVSDAGEKTPKSHNETIRINVEVLDNLLNLASELVLVRNQHLQKFAGQDRTGEEISRRLNAVTSELQSSIMGIRMQPLSNVFGKLPRIARDLAHRLEKQIEVVISGETVEVDKTILESLSDPLTHIIRNSCDHGLETPAQRLAVGKPATGTITVTANHEGGQILVSIQDDGHGIDPNLIRRKVLEKGLRTEEELRQLSPRQILNLIMLPGFSTAAKVSDISGRGVGMDVVRTSIEQLGGSLELESTPGHGTTITLALPLTLAIMSSLIITSHGQRFAIPQVNIEEVVCLFDCENDQQIEVLNGQEIYRYNGNILQLVRLNKVLDDPVPFNDERRRVLADQPRPHGTLNIAVVKIGAKRYGLAVDEVLGIEEIVVKPMHPKLKNLKCYLGAMILGDGTVSLILDIDGIARHALGQIHNVVAPATPETVVARSDEAQRVLLFRSGDKENFALALALIKRVDWINPAEIQFIGNRRFITIDGQSTQVVCLDQAIQVSPCEMREEMFLILPKHIKRPFGILASEFHDIKNVMGGFSSGGYSEDGILGTALLDGQLTVFPDIYRIIEKIEPEWFAADGKPRIKENNRDKHILLAEDTPFFRQLVKKYLESDCYQVTTAANGREALEALAQDKFDLLLSDLEMPFMNGWQLVEAVRADQRFSKLPAIALTSLDSDHDRQSALQSGFNDYIVKIEREKFLSLIGNFMHQAKDNII